MVNRIRMGADPLGVATIDFQCIRERRGWFIGLGVAFLVLGALAIMLPFVASLVTTVFIGMLMLVAGIAQGVHAIQNRRWGGSTWALVGALFYLVAGALVVMFPFAGKLALTLTLAGFLLAEGGLKVIRAVQHRGLPRWGWFVFDGLVTIALGLLIAAKWPSTAVWAIGLLVGVDLLIGGSSMLLIGIGAGSRVHARA